MHFNNLYIPIIASLSLVQSYTISSTNSTSTNISNPSPNNKYCPTSIDRCTNGGLSWLVTDPSAPPCWNNFNGEWNCAYKQANDQCNPSIFYVDITQCHYNPPPPPPPNNKYCPTSIDRCTNGGLSWLVTDPSAPPCWNNSNGAWNCAYKQANGQCNPSIFYVDITKCHYNTITPTCSNGICSPVISNSTT